MTCFHPIVFLIDVDNSLLDNDGIQRDFKDHLRHSYGDSTCARYWRILEDLFVELGYRAYLGALQRYRVEHPRHVELLAMSSFLIGYPFAIKLFPAVLQVDGRVLIYLHKEDVLGDVERRFPAERYVLVDDKLRILAAVKQFWGERVTTIFVRQASYAHDPRVIDAFPAADGTIEHIADLLDWDPLRPGLTSQVRASSLESMR